MTTSTGMPPLAGATEEVDPPAAAAVGTVASALGEDAAPAVLVALALFPEEDPLPDPLPELPPVPAGIGGFVRGKLTDAEL
jgi:hypothetical protein